MNFFVRACFLLLLSLSASVFAEVPAANGNFWQCTIYDGSNKQWSATSTYRKVAINYANSLCKKESLAPTTCRASRGNCERFVQGQSVKPMWVCTALDRTAMVWRSNPYSQRDDAALAAKAYCHQKSTVAETCYINLITCANKNEFSQ